MRRYYVSFIHGNGGITSLDVLLAKPMRTQADVTVMTEFIQSKGYEVRLILGWSKYETDSQPD